MAFSLRVIGPIHWELDGMRKKVPAGRIKLKRAYEPAAGDDGVRILIDRLWPRGVRKQDAAIERWAKDPSPSTELREVVRARSGALGGIPPALCRGASARIPQQLEELRAWGRQGPNHA